MLLPLSILNTLHLGRHEKLALFFVFTVGSFSIAASIIRFTIVIRALSGSNYTLMTLRELERWSVVEFSMALLAFCLPALRGFVVRIFGAGRRSTRESSGDDARRIAGIIPPLGVVGAADAEAQWGGGGGRRKHYLDTRVSVGEYVESLGKNRSRDGRERLKSFELAVRSKSESQERLRNTN